MQRLLLHGWQQALSVRRRPPPSWEPAALRDELEQELRCGLLEARFPALLDHGHGSYLCDFDHRWRPLGEQPKTVVFQSRGVWLAAHGWGRYPQDERYEQAARHGAAFLRDAQWDERHGGFFWRLERSGELDPSWHGVKHAYGLAFGIFGLAAYAQASGCAASADLAMETFRWLETRGHDPEYGGYAEYFTREGTPVSTATPATEAPLRSRDPLGTPVGCKSMNAHTHLLEALTALYRLRPSCWRSCATG